MKVTYTRSKGAGLSYEIDADRHGSYTISLQGKVIKRVSALADYLDKPKWGSRQLEAGAIEDAKNAIESLRTDGG